MAQIFSRKNLSGPPPTQKKSMPAKRKRYTQYRVGVRKQQRTASGVGPSHYYSAVAGSSAMGAMGYGARRRRRNIRTGGFLGIENKFADSEATATNLTTTIARVDPTSGSTQCLTAVAQGDGESQRDGRRYKMNSLHVRGMISMSAVTGGTPQVPVIIRVAIVLDTQSNGAALTATDVFKTATTAAQNVHAFRNLQYSQRFRVLYDKSYTMNAEAGAYDGINADWPSTKKQFKININIPETWAIVDTSATTANITSVTDNSIHLLAWADGTNLATIRYESRLRFVG